jgi:hypothetical protein
MGKTMALATSGKRNMISQQKVYETNWEASPFHAK